MCQKILFMTKMVSPSSLAGSIGVVNLEMNSTGMHSQVFSTAVHSTGKNDRSILGC